MAERRILYLVVLTAGLVFFWAYREWMAWMFLLAILVLPWLSLAISWWPMSKMEVLVRCPNYLQKGQRATAILAGRSSLPHPAAKGKLQITDRMTGESILASNGDELPTGHCAALQIQPVSTWTYDFLGLFRRKIKKHQGAAVLIRPAPVHPGKTPDLSRYLATAFKPKPGGGYAENHEMRLYRPGDNLRQIHWKLTAKTGKLILREPMEPLLGLAAVTLELSGSRDQIDEKLGKLLWVSNFLLQQSVSHQVHCLTGRGMVVHSVSREPDIQKTVDALLRCPVAPEQNTVEYVRAAWRYHIGGDGNES